MSIWEDLKYIYLQSLAERDDLPEETRDYVEEELEKEKYEDYQLCPRL